MNIDASEIKDEMNHQLQKAKSNLPNEVTPHKEVLTKLLDKVEEIDFQKEANTDKKLRNKHYVVITVEKILELAKKQNWGLCKRHDFIYLFNGAYWSQLEEDELKGFLGTAAEEMGVNKLDSKYHRFRDELLKQFKSLAHLPAPDHPDDVVLINLENGTVEINPLKEEPVSLRKPDQDDFLTYQLPFEYNATSEAPRFQEYLDRVLPDGDLQKLLAEYIGYVFVRSSILKLEKALLLYGTGGNGKSVFFEVVNALLGGNNVSNFTLKNLTDSKGYHRAKLANILVNYASEIDGQMDTALFKQLVSGEPVEARLPYGDPFTLTDYAKLIFNCNELPSDVEHTNAYFRRFMIVPFEITIPENEQDKELSKKIIDNELDGVFNWVLDGLKRLLDQKGFTKSEEVERQKEKYKRNSDTVLSFVDECDYEKSFTLHTRLSELYKEYRNYCEFDGYYPVSKRKFSRRLKNGSYKVERKEFGNVVYLIQK